MVNSERRSFGYQIALKRTSVVTFKDQLIFSMLRWLLENKDLLPVGMSSFTVSGHGMMNFTSIREFKQELSET